MRNEEKIFLDEIGEYGIVSKDDDEVTNMIIRVSGSFHFCLKK